MYSAGAKSNRHIRLGQTYRLLTACFLHGDLMHVGLNMASLFNIGPSCERLFGSAGFLGLYFVSGVGGNCFTYALKRSSVFGARCHLRHLIKRTGEHRSVWRGMRADGGPVGVSFAKSTSLRAICGRFYTFM
jgi:hypothetical protein